MDAPPLDFGDIQRTVRLIHLAQMGAAKIPGRAARSAKARQSPARSVVHADGILCAIAHNQILFGRPRKPERMPDLRPLHQPFALRREKLNAGVFTVGNIHNSAIVYGDAVHQMKLPLARAVRAPRIQKATVRVQMNDAGVAVAIRDKHTSIGRERDIGGSVEMAAVIARLIFNTIGRK